MLLLDFARRYARQTGASPGYLEQLEVLCKRLPWHVEDITTDMVDEYLTQALTSLAPVTVANHRRYLTTLLRAAQRERDLVVICTRGFRRVKTPRPVPRAFSLDEIRRLVEAARQTVGSFRGVKKSDFLAAWILSAYCLGLRTSDLWSLRWADVRGQRAYIAQSKTGSPHVAVFTAEALAACERLPRRQRIFGDFAAVNTIQQWVRACAKAAGLDGTTRFLRRSCATYAKVKGMSPQAKLGHLTPGLAEKHYVDQLLYEQETGLNGKPLPAVMS